MEPGTSTQPSGGHNDGDDDVDGNPGTDTDSESLPGAPPEPGTRPLGVAAHGTIQNDEMDPRSDPEDSDSPENSADPNLGGAAGPSGTAGQDTDDDSDVSEFDEYKIDYALPPAPPQQVPALRVLSDIESRSLEYFWAMKKSDGTVRGFNMYTSVPRRAGDPGKVHYIFVMFY